MSRRVQISTALHTTAVAAGPASSLLIPVFIGLVTRQGNGRSITDVPSPCGGGFGVKGGCGGSKSQKCIAVPFKPDIM
jgi:hypothetical protein